MYRDRVAALRPPSFPWLLPLSLLAAAALLGCGNGSSRESDVSPGESRVIADSIRAIVRNAYDLSAPDVPARMLSIYPDSGRVVSATAGRVTTTRALLGAAVQSFWDGVGQFMVRPNWTWDDIQVDVLTPSVAVMTAHYSVPHWTSEGDPHVIGGVWTAVWQRRGGRWLVTHEHLSDMPRGTAESIEAGMPRIPPTDSAATSSK